MAFSEFGKAVKKRLVDLDQTQKWLMEQVVEKTGLYIDGYYLHKILCGQRKAPKITAAICEILAIPNDAAVEETSSASTVTL